MTGRRATMLLLLPATLWFLILLVLPLIVILVYSLGDRAPEGGYAPALTLAQYANLPARWTAFQNTLTLAPLGTLVTLLAAYPLAYWLALRCDPRWRLFLLVLVIVPFWTSLLIRTYAWIFILGGRGLPALLGWLGLGEPRLINTPFAVLLGHRLRLSAADGVPDLCQPGEARSAAAGSIRGSVRVALAHLPAGDAAALAARASPPARCWCSSC